MSGRCLILIPQFIVAKIFWMTQCWANIPNIQNITNRIQISTKYVWTCSFLSFYPFQAVSDNAEYNTKHQMWNESPSSCTCCIQYILINLLDNQTLSSYAEIKQGFLQWHIKICLYKNMTGLPLGSNTNK